MNYIRITRDNIDREHICCAMSGKQSLRKKEWLKQRLEEGLVFCRSEERGKCFIEYLPTENAWVPIRAEGYLYINCLWIAGAMKGHGYANDLLAECSRDKGSQTADVSDCGISLLYLPLAPDARPPEFRDCAKHPEAAPDGFVLYYTDQCPYTSYWVPRVQETAREHGIPLRVIHITSREEAQRVPAPVTTYALFRDGRFLTQGIQSDKKFLALAGGKADGV